MSTKQALLQELHGFLAEFDSAELNKAADTDPGTSHPSGSSPDGTQSAPQGARAGENEKDVKATVPAGGVDAAASGQTPQEQVQLQIGLSQSSTGKDPSVEQGYKGTITDPGTSHLATADDGKKYGSDFSGKSFADLYKMASDNANDILAKIAVVNTKAASQAGAATPAATTLPAQAPAQAPAVEPAKTASAPAVPTLPAAQQVPAANSQQLATMAKAGYDLASAMASSTQTPEEAAKKEKDALFAKEAAGIIKRAYLAADLLANFLNADLQGQQQPQALAIKKAMEGDDEAEKEPKGDSGAAPADSGEEADGGGDADGGPPAPPAPDVGGAPQEDAVRQLLMALMEMGITPEDLLAVLTGSGGAGAAPPGAAAALPEAGAVPPPPAPPGGMGGGMMGGSMPGMEVAAAKRASLTKLANDAKTLLAAEKKNGKFRVSVPKSAQERELRNKIQSYVSDMIR